jgi:hypothetical protein
MLFHLSRTIKGIQELNITNSKKIILGMVLAPTTMPKEGTQKLNGSLNVALSTIELWGCI